MTSLLTGSLKQQVLLQDSTTILPSILPTFRVLFSPMYSLLSGWNLQLKQREKTIRLIISASNLCSNKCALYTKCSFPMEAVIFHMSQGDGQSMYLHLTEHKHSLTKIQQAVIITGVIKDNNTSSQCACIYIGLKIHR